MILKGLLVLLTILYMVSGKNVKIMKGDYPTLKWPSKYSVQANKYHMSTGLVEHLKYWRSGSSSRLEANDGAVIKIKKGKRMGKGKEYEIHPETTEEEINKVVCIMEKRSYVSPDDFLPNYLEYLRAQGPDNVKAIDCVKFTNARDSDSNREKTLWAFYNDTTQHWVPIRYTTKEINKWHGYFVDYEIWDFFNFKEDVDVDAFKVNYNCTSKEYYYDETPKSKNLDILSSLKPEQKKELDDAFSRYKRRFDKHYIDEEENETRKRVFYKKWRLVNKINNKNLGYKLALNKMSDRTDEERNRNIGLNREKPRKAGNIPFPYSEKNLKKASLSLPKEYDLRLEGSVGPVLYQEDCQSAWAFTTTAIVEGALARSSGGTWRKLSEQALLDCSWGFDNKGCDGGTYTNSYQWIMEHGLPTQQNYGTYANNNGFCKMENMTKTYKIKGYTDVTPFSVEALKVALINHGPISVNINYDSTLEMYDEGIFYDPDCSSYSRRLNHMMTLVGYGERDGDTFWILKNSKGPYWGTDGYLYISARGNNCGVMSQPTYVVI